MHLQVGERLEGTGPDDQPGGYVVTAVVSETRWMALYTGKKILGNFDFSAKRVRETEPREWLDVYLRTLRYPNPQDADYVTHRRALARAEIRIVLGQRNSGLWPQALDLLEIQNTRDPLAPTLGDAGEPIVVFAHPQGTPWAQWAASGPAMAERLAVLAEVLDFVEQCHAEGLLLLGIDPAELLIDRSQRVHYLGSQRAVPAMSPLLQASSSHALWARLYPPERWPRGHSAPECYQPEARPDVRSDVFSWGTLVLAVLLGKNPADIIQDQNRPFPLWQASHFQALEAPLAELSPSAIEEFAERLNLVPAALKAAWPGNFLHALRLCVQPERERRPASTQEWRSWVLAPPAPAFGSLDAILVKPGEVRLIFDASSLSGGLEMAVHRKVGSAPAFPGDGACVYEGPTRSTFDDFMVPNVFEAVHYSAFTRRKHAEGVTYSPMVLAKLWTNSLRNWAEQFASPDGMLSAEPMRVTLALPTFGALEVAETFRESPMASVHHWALHRLEHALRTGLRLTAAETVLSAYLHDYCAEVRVQAAVLAWTFAPNQSTDLLVRLMVALEEHPVSREIQPSELLEHLVIAEETRREAMQRLERIWPTDCPFCQQKIPLAERARHLQEAHGYVDDQGELLPIRELLPRLWRRVFDQRDRSAHERLLGIYHQIHSDDDAASSAYAEGLEMFGMGPVSSDPDHSAEIPLAIPYAAISEYLLLLRQCEELPNLARAMLRRGDPRVRQLAREAIASSVADQILRTQIDEKQAGPRIDEFAPGSELVDERIQIARLLPALGVDWTIAEKLQRRFAEDRLVRCRECQMTMAARELEAHLRREHEIFEFRGVRRDYEATRLQLLTLVCATPPDPDAWQTLMALASERSPEDPERRTLVWALMHLRSVPTESRRSALAGFAESLKFSPRPWSFLEHLLEAYLSRSYQALSRRIALEAMVHMQSPAPPSVVDRLRPLLAAKEYPLRMRQRCTMALLRLAGTTSDAAVAILRAYLGDSGKVRGIEKLRHLEQRFGQSPAIDALTKLLDDEIRMTCPRCSAQLPKREMLHHLWERHQLVLDGQRAREPWKVLDDWVVDYGLENDAELLQRCRDLALRADPIFGADRLHRMILQHDIQDTNVLKALLRSAKARGASVCPECFAMNAAEPPEPATDLHLGEDTLSGHGFLLTSYRGWLFPRVRFERGNETLFEMREPGRGIHRHWVIVSLVVPIVLALAIVLIRRFPDLWHLVLLLSLGLLLMWGGLVHWLLPSTPHSVVRLMRGAWQTAVPFWAQSTLPLGDSEWSFLRDLVSRTRPEHVPRAGRRALRRLYVTIRDGNEHASAHASILGLLGRLDWEQACRIASEIAPLVFANKRPVRLFEDTAKIWQTASHWSAGQRHFLGIILGAAAFSQGWTADDLFDLGNAFAALRNLLDLDNRWRWRLLALVFAVRNERPWNPLSARARSIFDALDDPRAGAALLDECSDYFLWVPAPRFFLGSRGLWFEDKCVTTYNAAMDVVVEYSYKKRRYEIGVGPNRWVIDRDAFDVAAGMRRWLLFYFDEFLPQLRAIRPNYSDVARNAWRTHTTACAGCGKSLVPCLGDLALLVTE